LNSKYFQFLGFCELFLSYFSRLFFFFKENAPLLVTEDSEKVKAIHFKFFVRKVYAQDVMVRLTIEHIGGFYTMTAGLSPE
jgi:hypothetical protein